MIGLFFCIVRVIASEHLEKSVYCPELHCWSHVRCVQHTKHYSALHQKFKQLLAQSRDGARLRRDLTHIVEHTVPKISFNSSSDVPACNRGRYNHFNLNCSSIIEILSHTDNKPVAKALVTDSEKEILTVHAHCLDQYEGDCRSIGYSRSSLDGSLILYAKEQYAGFSWAAIHLVPIHALMQASLSDQADS